LAAELDKLLRDSFVWYSPFSVLGASSFTIYLLVIIPGLLAELIGLVGMTASSGEIIVQRNAYVAIVAAVVLITTILSLFVRKRWFPVSTFRIGDGVIRANKSASVRQGVASVLFGGVILGLLVHVFGSRIHEALFAH
jgi:hypothetical protein